MEVETFICLHLPSSALRDPLQLSARRQKKASLMQMEVSGEKEEDVQ
jgi:hypothetical protein